MMPDRTSLTATLARLRWFAIAGQLAAIGSVAFGMGMQLPLWPMGAAIVLLALFNLHAIRHRGDAAPWQVFGHIVVDVAVLAFLIGCSGGPANPFTSLFLLPIAFAALALPQRWIYAIAALCGLGYALAAAFGRPLPHAHGLAMDGFDLHLWGMAVNFVICAAVFIYFLARMAAQRRSREAELARLRERLVRDDGILALATHAASVAHELNTPLATMLLALDELEADGLSPSQGPDVALLRTLAQTCSERVRELARATRPGEGIDPEQVVARWSLLRPAVALHREGSLAQETRVDAAVAHLLRALLDNAADAGHAAGRTGVELSLRSEHGILVGRVRDHGNGLDGEHALQPASLFRSGKPGGLGVGLALSQATVERLGGSLALYPATGGGTCVEFRVPLLEPAA